MATKRPPSLAQLEQALKEKTREVDVLHRITDSISNTLDLEAVLKHIVEIVVEVTKADACLLYLLSDGEDELILRASKNPHPKLIGRITIGMGEGITGWVAQERTRVVIPSNASDDPRFKFFHNLPEDRHQAFVSVPIMAKKEVVGVINVQHNVPSGTGRTSWPCSRPSPIKLEERSKTRGCMSRCGARPCRSRPCHRYRKRWPPAV